ncbi:IS30 family transposase [Parafrankia sp. FMc6]|uniref:IS30 family transposase n=1 Tax=Parafrankia soli TaxID=2599596 RepID=UPI0034D6CFCB
MELTLEDRESISRGLAVELSHRAIGVLLDRSQSVISREVARNGGNASYRAADAQRRAEENRRRPKVFKLEKDRRLHDAVAERLAADYSPQQVANRLAKEFPDDPEMRVSHETIYQTLFVQARGELRTQLKLALRSGRAVRRPHGSTRPKQARIAGMVSISERPAEVADRAVPGHWEGDMIVGKAGASQILTLVERQTRFVMLARVPYDRFADRVALILSLKVRELPEALFRSITWDQGTEMAEHARFTVTTGIPVYFCDPHSPWQRGSNENTNGLLRQYFPKGTDLSDHTQTELDRVADLLNRRPRQTLDWDTPAERLNRLLLSQSG